LTAREPRADEHHGALARKLFVNLAVRDVRRAQAFFAALDFGFDPRFTDERAACMIVGPQAFVMLLAEAFFKRFTHKPLCDTRTHAEAAIVLSCPRRVDVDALLDRAIAHGGTRAGEPLDHGFRYASRFFDLDGHCWELSWSDPHTVEA
jgi:predicted lactoylglutathione lyase